MRRSNLSRAIQLIVILVTAFALKYHYSTASVNQLRWILAPTTFLVELVTGTDFRFEPYAGYLSDDRTFLIAISCSGVNFLIIAFVVLALGRRCRGQMEWRFLPIALFIAYLSTLIANTVRIVLAIYLQRADLEIGGLTYDEMHRIEGVVIYFGSLVVLYYLAERIQSGRRYDTSQLARHSLLPIAIYYAITLGIPVLRGAYGEPEFWKHTIVVIIAPVVLLLPFVILRVADRMSVLRKAQ